MTYSWIAASSYNTALQRMLYFVLAKTIERFFIIRSNHLKKLLLIAAIIASPCFMASKALTVYTIPGSSGKGSEQRYVQDLLGSDVHIVPVENPGRTADLGQAFCVRYLRNAVDADGIIFSTSQGTATALNYVAHEDQGHHIKGLILESVLASGNCVVEWTMQGPLMNKGWMVDLPFSYYWMPYIFQLLKFQTYLPAGKQPIKSIGHIPNDLPIIIVHSEDDERLAYRDACALYYGLRAQGNNNVYFITKPGKEHHNLIQEQTHKEAIQNILKKHGLLAGDYDASIDLSSYQPDPAQFKERFETIVSQERIHEFIGYMLLLMLCGYAVKIIMKY